MSVDKDKRKKRRRRKAAKKAYETFRKKEQKLLEGMFKDSLGDRG